MDYTISVLYEQRSEHFRFKGSRPGESENTKINELAIVGDAVLSLELRSVLTRKGYNASQITLAHSRILSNAALADWAVSLGLLDGRYYATHASGTLLEALVGYWYLSGQSKASKIDIFDPWTPAFRELFYQMTERAHKLLSSANTIDSLFE